MSESVTNKRLAKNSGLMYFRMLIVMVINLFTVRYILCALGQEDYGIFNVVAGVVTMLQSVGAIFATSTQRFFSFALGKKQYDYLQDIFSASVNIYILFIFVVFVLAESIGLWFLNVYLVIPVEKMGTANILFQLSVFTFMVSLFQTPFLSAIIAHEDLGIYAKVSILDCALRFIVAIGLSYVIGERLVIYGWLLLLIPIIVLVIYIYKTRVYRECRYKFTNDKQLYKEILSFSGWTIFSSLAGIGINQIQTILINIFYGPIANAARAISVQINNAINSFSSSFIVAVRPPMIKTYAEENYVELNKLFNFSNKFIYYCLIIICIPLIFEMDTVLFIWLNITDEQPIIFSQLIVIYSVILALNNPLSIIAQATGKLRTYSVPVEMTTLLCPFLTAIFFYLKFPAYYAFLSMILSIVLAHIVRIVCVKKLYNELNLRDYLIQFVLRAIAVTIITVLLVFFIHISINNPYIRLGIVFLINISSILIFVWLIGITSGEKIIVKTFVLNLFKRIYG